MDLQFGIVGALVLGQAAVSASIVSPILIIIIAITGIGSKNDFSAIKKYSQLGEDILKTEFFAKITGDFAESLKKT